MENHLVLAGTVSRAAEVRRSPAGIPIARFVLMHRSRKSVGGVTRDINCTIQVVASGEALAARARALRPGSMARVSGVIARASHHRGDFQLALHAEALELLSSDGSDASLLSTTD